MFLGFADHFQRKKQEFFLGMTSVCVITKFEKEIDERDASRWSSPRGKQVNLKA